MFFNTENNKGNWKYLFVAFITALILWYSFNAREQIERIVSVRLDYKGVPQNLVVVDGQLQSVNVRLRGSVEMLRTFSGRELSYTIDLSGITQGTNTIPLSGIQIADLRPYHVLEVTPPRMVLQVDQVSELRLPVVLQQRACLFSEDMYMEDADVTPTHVAVRGPSSILAVMDSVIAEVSLNLDEEDQRVLYDAPILAPQSVDVCPEKVNVSFKVGMKRKAVSLRRGALLPEDKLKYIVKPEQVTIVVSIPQSLLNDYQYLAQIQAGIDGKDLDHVITKEGDSVKKRVEVSIPKASRIIKVYPEFVTIYPRKKIVGH